jgi:uncharacterized repeat protein (TIGR03803 family)
MKAKLRFALLALLGIANAQAAVEHIIHSFGVFPKGANPYGPLARDSSGNFYGTTYQGGTANLGVVFKLGTGGYQVLHSFEGGSDGASPYAGVTLDSAGNIYGTTYAGGASNVGVVYKIDASGSETVLYTFTGGADGGWLLAGVILDSKGNLYGTTAYGGSGPGPCLYAGCGVVYKLDPTGQETVLHAFTGGADGGNPYAGLTADSAGNFYGTTYAGGITTGGCFQSHGCGVIYRIDTSGNETVLYTFGGTISTGAAPYAGVILDPAGNLYGTTLTAIYELDIGGHFTILQHFYNGFTPYKAEGNLVRDSEGNLYGTAQYSSKGTPGAIFELEATGKSVELYSFSGGGYNLPSGPNPGVILDSSGNLYGVTAYAGVGGMVFKLAPSRQETTLYSFAGAAGGSYPGKVVMGPGGDLYGTTYDGGKANAGTLYKLDRAGHETVLYSFTGGADGANPGNSENLVFDPAGNLYGTATYGGVASGTAGFGTAFMLDTSGHLSVLHAFTGGADGGLPSGLIRDSAGNLYGTAAIGGAAGLGVVFKLDASGQESVLHSFAGPDGATPESGVIRDSARNLYGTTYYGGSAGLGALYQLDPQGQETVLYSFPGGPNGSGPYAGVIRDSAGNIYGTTAGGGGAIGEEGYGVVFELTAAGQYDVLYTFTGGTDGGASLVGLVRDLAGNLYGANSHGGTQSCNLGIGCGVVYKLDPSGQLTVLHSFTGGADGGGSGALALDPAGDILGPSGPGPLQGGMIYELSPK